MKKFCLLLAVGIFLMSGAAFAYLDGTLLKEKNGSRVYKINNGFKILVDASEIGGRKPIEVSTAELSQIKDVSIGQSYGSMSAQSYGAAQNGQAVKNYAIPGNATIGTTPMPSMAIGGITTPATIPSSTHNPIKAIGDKVGQGIREMNNKRVAAGVFVPSISACGSKETRFHGKNFDTRIGGQIFEVPSASIDGFSFEAACQAHDACYDNCQKTKKEACDNEFYQLMTAICDGATNFKSSKERCLGHRNAFYNLVAGSDGEAPFAEAKKACTSVVKNSNQAMTATASVQSPTQTSRAIQTNIASPTPQIAQDKLKVAINMTAAEGLNNIHNEEEYRKVVAVLFNGLEGLNNVEKSVEEIKYAYNLWKQPYCKNASENIWTVKGIQKQDWYCDPTDDTYYNGLGHTGIDIASHRSQNLKFYAVSEGDVIKNGGGDYNIIAIYDKAKNITTLYLHASEINTKEIWIGNHIKVGTWLGKQGSHGENSEAPHVHFGVRPGKRFDDCNPKVVGGSCIEYPKAKELKKERILQCVVEKKTTESGCKINDSLDPIAVAMMYLAASPQQVALNSPSTQQNQVKARVEIAKPIQKVEVTAQPIAPISHASDAPVKPSVQSSAYAMPTQKTPMNGGATANMMAANAAQYDLANCLGPELKRKISMPISSRNEFLQLEKEVMAEAKRICGDGAQQQGVTSAQNRIQPVQQSVIPSQANNQAVINSDISALAARNDCVKRLLPSAEQKLKAIPTNINPTDYTSRQHAILSELYRNCGLPQGYTVPPQNPVTATQYPAIVAAVPPSNMPTHVQPPMQPALQPVMQAVNPSQRVVAPVVAAAPVQPHTQPPPANIRSNALFPIAVAQAQPIAPQPQPQMQQKAPTPTSSLQFNGFSSNYSTTSTPYQPTIALSGSGFNSVTQIKWTCAMPNGASCGAMPPWTSANWSGKFIRYSDTSAVVAPMLLIATDLKGTYHWTATFYGAGQPVARSFAVTKN